MKIVLLGDNKINAFVNKENVYHYIFNNDKYDRDDVILESNFLNQIEINTSFRHLAEFSAYYVFWKHNPLSLKDNDTLCLLSSLKFENLSKCSFENLIKISPKIDELLLSNGGIYSFLHRPDDVHSKLDMTKPFNDLDSGLFNINYLYPLVNHLRPMFDNYPPHPNRHYFCFTYSDFKLFYSWVHQNIFNLFFNENFTEKLDNNNDSIITKTYPRTIRYTNHRAFGLIVEHFHHKFFYETKTHQYWHPFGNDDPDYVYKIDFYDENLNWKINNINY